jgi:hypothetical protein
MTPLNHCRQAPYNHLASGGWSPTGWTHCAYQARRRLSQWDVCALPAEHRATAARGHGQLPGEHVLQCLQIARVDASSTRRRTGSLFR